MTTCSSFKHVKAMIETFLLYALVFAAGGCAGSFMNVCIYRIPRGRSIVYPGSSCPFCRTPIPFYLNIPMISYLVLLGRCRYCRASIGFRYFLVELLTALAACAVLYRFGPGIEALFWFILVCVLITISFIDIDHGIIPDVISLPGIVFFALSAFFATDMTALDILSGVAAGGGSLYLVALVYYLIKKQEGMGGGDIKLLAMIGAATGVKGVIVTIFLGSVLGTLAGAVIMIRMRASDLKLKIPFGPFLAMGAIIYIFFGTRLINWYLHGHSLLQ